MLRIFVFAAGFIMIAFAIRYFKDEIMLYKNGVKNEATLILMKPYNHVDINEVRNKVYYVGIEPILEVNNEDKKVIIEYDDYDEFKDLKVGDKVKVIYPKENISEIKRYSFLKIFKTSIVLSLIAIFIIFVGTSLL
ncbi:MAG: hypothetical protein MR491_03710 [Mollicutes bacterium]|uniref:hypothetical protein n=1 Tax=Clostridium sp. TaxID=1506 RepID=UPI00267365D4|nr:hypothetical protein [Clostridium sp.]MCI7030821.1 hypothetical protein [Clostridium sp.]MCI7225228.1 hypothetical protein [Mollicutes bacterium]